jgi:hypothetical protein
VKRKKFSWLINLTFEIGIMAFFELRRRVQTTEADDDDEDTSFGHGFLILPLNDAT